MVKYKLSWLGTKRAEKCLLVVIIFTAVFMLLYQSLIAQSPLWQVINRVGSDAQCVVKPMGGSDNSIIFQLINFSTLPKAKILVNGKIAGDFTHPYVNLPVAEGDLVEIDTCFYEHLVTIKVLESSSNIVLPQKGVQLSGKKTVLSFGKVKLSEKQAGGRCN